MKLPNSVTMPLEEEQRMRRIVYWITDFNFVHATKMIYSNSFKRNASGLPREGPLSLSWVKKKESENEEKPAEQAVALKICLQKASRKLTLISRHFVETREMPGRLKDGERHGTGDKDEKSVNGTQISIGKFPPGKRDYLFRNSVFSGNFPVERTEKSCSIYNPTGISGIFW